MFAAQTWIQVTREPEFAVGVLAGALLALILYAILRLSRRQPDAVAAFRNDFGEVLVSRRALQEQVQAYCEEVAEVVRATVVTKGHGHGLSLTIFLKLRGDAHLTGISNQLQERTQRLLKEHLGMENLSSIDIQVSGIVSAPERVEDSSAP